MTERSESPDPSPAPGPGGLDRRSFVRRAVAGGAGLALSAVPGSGSAAARSSGEERAARGTDPRAASRAPVPPFELEGLPVDVLQERMADGALDAVGLVTAYLGRIRDLDRSGPELRQVLELNPDALAIARRRDRERSAGRLRGPLHGIPVLLKDNIDTGDRMSTAAGSLALEGTRASEDAHLVARLRAAGAVILGKANLSEWANFRSRESSSGWSARGGQGRNPYVLDRSPCGSSSGSAAAVAASYAPLAVGTETNGSIMCPASANSCVAVKPTVGAVSRSGIVPIAETQDTAGPFATTVRDAALLLEAMAGFDPDDPVTGEAPEGARTDLTRHLAPDALQGARIGVPRARMSGFTGETDELFEGVLEALEEAGAVLVDAADVPHLGEYGAAEFTVLLHEFRDGIDRYLAGRGGDAGVSSLEEVVEFNRRNREREMPFFGQDLLERALETDSLESPEYREARERILRLSREEGIDAAFREHDVDAMVAVTSSPPWPIDLVNGDSGHGSSYSPWAIAGYPGVTVPAGYVFGLPVGVSFYGRAWDEARLLGYAFAFEQATGVRRDPEFLPTVDLAGS